jgi:hypothetical protein
MLIDKKFGALENSRHFIGCQKVHGILRRSPSLPWVFHGRRGDF